MQEKNLSLGAQRGCDLERWTNLLQKKNYKTAVYAAWGVEWSGPTLTCSDQCASIVCLPASVEKKRENSFCLEKGKCFAVRSAHESKVSVQLFQFKSRLDSPRVLHNDSRERGFFLFRKIHPGFFHVTHCDLSTNQCSLFFRLNTFTIRPFFFFRGKEDNSSPL